MFAVPPLIPRQLIVGRLGMQQQIPLNQPILGSQFGNGV